MPPLMGRWSPHLPGRRPLSQLARLVRRWAGLHGDSPFAESSLHGCDWARLCPRVRAGGRNNFPLP